MFHSIRRRRWWVLLRTGAILALALGAAAFVAVPAAAADPLPIPTPVTSRTVDTPAQVFKDIDYIRPADCHDISCSVQLDVYVPAGTGPFSTVVLIRGGPTGPDGRWYVGPFAEQLAAAGLIVFNADYRDIAATGGGYPTAFQDIACAIRYARANSAAYGGDGSRITLVGHSLGGYAGSVVALTPDEFQSDCLTGGYGKPDAFVGLSGNYDLTSPPVANDMIKFYGGAADDTSDARGASDPFALTGAAPIPVRLVSGLEDHTVPSAVAEAFAQRLNVNGWDVDLTLVPGGDHQTILDEDAYGATSVRIVVETAELIEL